MNSYATAAAFKQALEARLRAASSSGVDFARRRQLLVFDRFLARITREFGDAMMLKGGLVVELRVERARITNEGLIYEGKRYRVNCVLAGKSYGQPFGLDIAFSDPILGEPDIVVADDVLGFAGIEPPNVAPNAATERRHRAQEPRGQVRYRAQRKPTRWTVLDANAV